MLKATTIVLVTILLSKATFAQLDTIKVESDFQIKILDSVAVNDVLPGFAMSNGFAGYQFKMDSGGRFRKIDFDCVTKFQIDSGSWKLSERHQLILRSEKHTTVFKFLRFDRYVFIVEDRSIPEFEREITRLRNNYPKLRTHIFDGETYSPSRVLGWKLFEKYYGRELE